MKIPLLRGRQFRATDSSETPLVAIINETLAKHFFQYTNPVGREIRTLGDDGKPGQWREIVGVVGDVSDYLGEDPKKPQIYVPLLQDSTSAITFVLRTTVNPAVLMPAVRQTIKTIDSEQPIYGIRTMTQVLDLQRTGDRFAGEMLGFFTILALGLAAMGTYGVVASIVVQRTHEIGLRMALGAQRSDVLRLMVRRGMALAGIGMITGLVLAIPIPRMLANAYSDSTFENTIIFVISPILILLSAGLASYLPARRAARVDPMVALRHE
jgi:putative ABC transport system permease protein